MAFRQRAESDDFRTLVKMEKEFEESNRNFERSRREAFCSNDYKSQESIEELCKSFTVDDEALTQNTHSEKLPKLIDIRNYKGEEYLDLLFGDEKKLNLRFITQQQDHKEASKFDSLPALSSSKREVMESLLEDGPVEDNKVYIVKQESERDIDLLEQRLTMLQQTGHPQSILADSDEDTMVYIDDDSLDEVKTEMESVDEEDNKDEVDDDCSEGTAESMEGEDLPSARDLARGKMEKEIIPTRGLKKLSLLSFLFSRKKPGFKAKRDLRSELLKKGVNLREFDNPQAKLSNVDKSIDAFAAKRHLRNELNSKGVYFNKI